MIGLTTNGLTLTRQLVALQRAGLDALNISLDTLRADRFERITRRRGWERVIAGIDLALQLGYSPVKVIILIILTFFFTPECEVTLTLFIGLGFIIVDARGSNRKYMHSEVAVLS